MLAIVEIAADRPLAALTAIDEALVVLGEIEHPMLRYQLAEHRTWALAMLGRAPPAKQWLAKAEKLAADLAVVDAIDEQDLVATRARTLEACGQLREAIEIAQPHAERLPEAFVTGTLNLVVGRCALALGDEGLARIAVERAALSRRQARLGVPRPPGVACRSGGSRSERRQPRRPLRREDRRRLHRSADAALDSAADVAPVLPVARRRWRPRRKRTPTGSRSSMSTPPRRSST